jgi:biotin carboxyl carrier protein
VSHSNVVKLCSGCADKLLREAVLLKEWELKRAEREGSDNNTSGATAEGTSRGEETSMEWPRFRPTKHNTMYSGLPLVAPLFASVWKIKVLPGTVVKSPEDVLVILEAMKTEIPLKAGKRFVGKIVTGLGQGIEEGATVSPGTPILYLEA